MLHTFRICRSANIDNMDQSIRMAQVIQELVSQPPPLVRTGDKSRDI